MLFRVAIDFRGGGLEDACLHPLGQPKHVVRPVDPGLGGLHRVELVVNQTGWAG
jgi:hypothetical protein